MALHSRVDYARDARLGPGVTFATHLLELLVRVCRAVLSLLFAMQECS